MKKMFLQTKIWGKSKSISRGSAKCFISYRNGDKNKKIMFLYFFDAENDDFYEVEVDLSTGVIEDQTSIIFIIKTKINYFIFDVKQLFYYIFCYKKYKLQKPIFYCPLLISYQKYIGFHF